jgi:hypothetical protein
MSFTMAMNIGVMVLCAAVLVQSWRLMHNLKAIRGPGLREMILALDHSTHEASAVLGRLKAFLATDLADKRRSLAEDCAMRDELHESLKPIVASIAAQVAEGVAMRDELKVIVEIADSVANRIMDAADKSKAPVAATEPEVLP